MASGTTEAVWLAKAMYAMLSAVRLPALSTLARMTPMMLQRSCCDKAAMDFEE